MTSKQKAVFGIFKSADLAQRAADTLMESGFSNSDISVLLPDAPTSKAFAHEKETKAPEGAAAGVTAGGMIGGLIGVLAGVGAIALPGLGSLIAAGPIIAGLAGLGVGGALGGLVGALIGMGIPEYEAKRYVSYIKKGGILMSVHCDRPDEISLAKNLLKATGAMDIACTSERPTPSEPTQAAAASSLGSRNEFGE
ncbi:MAG: DUF3341 domain-containing protein [Steroidobacteraceae bacterium]|jgi:hypothetical protein